MNPGSQFDDFTEDLNLDADKRVAFREAMLMLAESDEFVLVFTRGDSQEPEVYGYGEANRVVLEGLRIAALYMQGELGRQDRDFDVKKLVGAIKVMTS